MARRDSRPDPKEAALAETRCLNPHPEQVRDPAFLSSDFFDARDAVQVKYEMVRKVKADGAPVTEAAAAFGYSRPAYYAGGRRAGALRAGGAGARQARAARRRTSSPRRSSPGPRNSWPPTRRCARRSCRTGSRRPSACACTPARSRKRWPAAGSATPKAADLPAREMRKEEHPSLSLLTSPGHAAAEPGARPDAGQDNAPGGGLDARYEQLRHAALHARAEAFPLGLGVLTGKGVTAWRHALAGLTCAAGPHTAAPARQPPGTHPAAGRRTPGPGGRRAHQRPGGRRARRDRHRPVPVTAVLTEGDPMLPDTAASKVTAAHLSRRAFSYVRQSSLKQVIHNTESAIRQYDLRGKAISLGWDASQITVIDIDQGQSGASAADREGFQQLVAEVSLGRAGIVLGLECSRLARNSADWHQLLELCAMTGTLICDEDGLYDPRNFNDRLLLGMKGQLSEYELHFIRARLRGGQLSKARRGELIMPLPVGLVYDAAGHVILDPDTAIQGALRHLFTTFEATGSATAVVKAFRAAGLPFPWRHQKGPRKGEVDWQPLRHHTVLRVLHNPRYAGAFTYGRRRDQNLPGGKTVTTKLPRDEWISFIPGAHPGYITLDQYEANIAKLAANAAAHGRDRAAGPPREGPALLQGIIICGRCGGRMTVRYHTRGTRHVPTYACQRDGIENARPFCAVIPGHTLDQHVGQLLIDTLTPLAVEAALQVSAELRAASRRGRRAARRPRRARPLPRRPGPPPLPGRRPRQPARRRHPRSRLEHRAARPQRRPGRLRQSPRAARRAAHRRPEGPDRPARHRPARHLERPRHPAPRTQAHRPAAAHRRHRHPHQRHHHRARPPGRRPAPHPHPAGARAGLETPADPRRHHRRDRPAPGPPHLRRDRRHPPPPRPGQRRRTALHPRHGAARHPHLPATQPPPAAGRRRADPAQPDGRAARRVHRHRQRLVPRRNCQRAAV